MEEKLNLTREGTGELVDSTLYKQIMGRLRYLTAMGPDLVYSVGRLSRLVEIPRPFASYKKDFEMC